MPIKHPKHLLIIGGGVFQVPAIKTAKSMALKVVVTDYNPEAEAISTLPSILPNSSTEPVLLME